MKTPKTYYPIIAAATLGFGGFVTASFGDESNPTQQAVITQAAKEDPVHARLNEEIVLPLNVQAIQRSSFSRMKPSASTQYNLVEAAPQDDTGIRSFQVMRKTTSFRKKAEPTSSEFLKLRYLENTSEVLVSFKDSWVKVENHPLLKHLPKPKPAQKITP